MHTDDRRPRTRQRRRYWSGSNEDPLQGVANLFDVAMVFAVALLVSMVMYLGLPSMLSRNQEATLVVNPGTESMEVVQRNGTKLTHYRISRDRARGEGTRLGTAYRLKSGEVVYVPEGDTQFE